MAKEKYLCKNILKQMYRRLATSARIPQTHPITAPPGLTKGILGVLTSGSAGVSIGLPPKGKRNESSRRPSPTVTLRVSAQRTDGKAPSHPPHHMDGCANR